MPVAITHSSVSGFQQTTLIPAHLRAYLFLTIEDVELVERIEWYRVAFDSVRDIFDELSSSSMAIKAIACTSYGLDWPFFSAKNAEIMQCDFTFLLDWADASVLLKMTLMRLNVPSTFPTKSLFELFSVIQLTYAGEEALIVQANWTMWSSIVNAGVVTVDKRSINHIIAP